MTITACRESVEPTFLNLQDCDVQGTATEVKDHDIFACTLLDLFIMKTTSDGGSSWLIYYLNALQACYITCPYCSSSLLSVKVGWHCYDALRDVIKRFKLVLGSFLYLSK